MFSDNFPNTILDNYLLTNLDNNLDNNLDTNLDYNFSSDYHISLDYYSSTSLDNLLESNFELIENNSKKRKLDDKSEFPKNDTRQFYLSSVKKSQIFI